MAGAHKRYEEDKDYSNFNKMLAEKLKAARKKAGLSQGEFSEASRISKSVISKSENGNDPQKASAWLVKKYADICGRDITYFFEDIDIPSTNEAAKDEKIKVICKNLTWFSIDELTIVYSLVSQYMKVRKRHWK